MEVRVKGLPGRPVAEIEEQSEPAGSGACNFCARRTPDWDKLGKNAYGRACRVSMDDIPNVPWIYRYVAVDASAILEATPDEVIIEVAEKRLRRLPLMVACWHCRKRHKQRLRQELKKVGLVLLR